MFNNAEIEQLPEIQIITFKPLDDKAVLVELLSMTFVFSLLIAALINVYLFTPLSSTTFAFVPGILLSCLIVALMSLTYHGYKFKGYALREHDIAYKTGLFWQRITLLPFNRIQHLETHHGPLERKFNLATLKLYTAGGNKADLTIFGLNEQLANEIRQLLLDKIQSEKVLQDD